jgi:hypothetical protein
MKSDLEGSLTENMGVGPLVMGLLGPVVSIFVSDRLSDRLLDNSLRDGSSPTACAH